MSAADTSPPSDTDAAGDYHRQSLQAGAECLAAALDYCDRGWSALAVCPPDHMGVGKTHAKSCKHPGKAPWGPWEDFQERLPTEADIRRKWHDNPGLNVGIALGPVSGLVRVDVDGPGGERMLVELSGGDLPATLEFSSGRDNGGRGLLYAIPAGVALKTTPFSAAEKKCELRFQAEGAQTVLPPSRHKDGARYLWRPGHGPGEIEPARMPAWLIVLMSAPPAVARRPQSVPSANGRAIHEGGRNTTLTSLAGTMRRRGMGHASILAALVVENQERCDPPLEDAEVATIAGSVARYAPGGEAVTGGAEPDEDDDGRRKPYGRAVILEHLRKTYRPAFRRGDLIYTHDGREVRRTEACFGAPDVLLEALKGAFDVPKDDEDKPRLAAMPAFFKKWAPTAWANLLGSLPEEEASAEIVEPAEEEFRGLVRALLLTLVALGKEVKTEEGTFFTSVERKTLIEWACSFAKDGPWKSVRSYLLWCRRDKPSRICVAMRPELAAQVPGSALAKMSHRRFAGLAEMYRVGSSCPAGKDCRPGGRRAIELTPEFLAELCEGPGEVPGLPEPLPDEPEERSREGELFSGNPGEND
jgi:putative DNA primase/helicase